MIEVPPQEGFWQQRWGNVLTLKTWLVAIWFWWGRFWPQLVRATAIACSAIFVCLLVVPLVWAAIQWWIQGDDHEALHTVMPFRYVLEHPPNATLAVLAAGCIAVLAFFRPIERFLSTLREGPWGMKVGPEPAEEKKLPNPQTVRKEGDTRAG